ncbi:MAG TPA: GNAT family N-acetyltransferase [Candidatus Saccharimonadales bacterium]|nr:GNAT family N-acetyltransferase [Candidatus Saccharimonadales bacterium]
MDEPEGDDGNREQQPGETASPQTGDAHPTFVWHEPDKHEITIVTRGGSISGNVDPETRTAEVEMVYVNEEVRGQGRATALRKAFAAEVDRQGATSISSAVIHPAILRILDRMVGEAHVEFLDQHGKQLDTTAQAISSLERANTATGGDPDAYDRTSITTRIDLTNPAVREGFGLDKTDQGEILPPPLPSFDPYRDAATHIEGLLSAEFPPESIPGYVRTDGQNIVYKMNDGTLMKLPYTDSRGSLPPDVSSAEGSLAVTHLLIPLLRGIGVAGLEQMITGTSYGYGAAIVEPVPGKVFDELTPTEVDAIPRTHFEGLIHACVELARRGLVPDYKRLHLRYDPYAGFTVTNYQLAEYSASDLRDAGAIAAKYVQSRWLLHKGPPHAELSLAGRHFINLYGATFGKAATDAMLERFIGKRR